MRSFEKSRWVKGNNIDVSEIIRGFNNSFKSSVGDSSWGDTNARDQKIIALTTKVNHLSIKVTKDIGSTLDPATPNKYCHACPKWRIKKKGDIIKDPDTGTPMA